MPTKFDEVIDAARSVKETASIADVPCEVAAMAWHSAELWMMTTEIVKALHLMTDELTRIKYELSTIE